MMITDNFQNCTCTCTCTLVISPKLTLNPMIVVIHTHGKGFQISRN